MTRKPICCIAEHRASLEKRKKMPLHGIHFVPKHMICSKSICICSPWVISCTHTALLGSGQKHRPSQGVPYTPYGRILHCEAASWARHESRADLVQRGGEVSHRHLGGWTHFKIVSKWTKERSWTISATHRQHYIKGTRPYCPRWLAVFWHLLPGSTSQGYLFRLLSRPLQGLKGIKPDMVLFHNRVWLLGSHPVFIEPKRKLLGWLGLLVFGGFFCQFFPKSLVMLPINSSFWPCLCADTLSCFFLTGADLTDISCG